MIEMPPLDERVTKTLPHAFRLVGAVRDRDQDVIQDIYDAADLPALLVALAALVDDTRTPKQLLGWTHRLPKTTGCGLPSFHASFERHRSRGETCDWCAEGEREYQRNRPDRRTGARARRTA